MKLDQSNETAMFTSQLKTLMNFKPIWEGNPVMVTAVNSLKSGLDTLDAMNVAQKASTKGITQTKEQAKTSMINLTYGHIMAGRAYATSIGDLKLKDTLNYRNSTLLRLKDKEVYDVSQVVFNALLPVIGDMDNYGATGATLDALKTSYITFGDMIGEPRTQKVITVEATKNIKDIINELRALNKDTLDPLMEQYKTSNKDFYDKYHLARKIIDIGHRTNTIVTGVITDGSNNPVRKALVTMRTTKKKKKTGVNGKYKFMYVKPGPFIIDVSAQGYSSASVKVTITEYEVNKLNIQINKL